MKFDAAFDLAGELARIHAKNLEEGTSAIHLVPVVVDELSGVLPALDALCRIGEGLLLDAINDDRLHIPVPASPSPIRRAAVQLELKTSAKGGTIDIVYTDVSGNRIDAQVLGRDPAYIPSAGEAMTLAVARALMHAELDKHEFAVLVYSDNTLDITLRPALWDVGVLQLAGSASPVLKTLAFVVESSYINVEQHCRFETGMRFAIQSGRLLRRNSPDALGNDASQIAGSSDPVVLFLGAGFAQSSRLPIGNTVRNEAIARLLNITDTMDPEELCRRFHAYAEGKSNLLLDSEKTMNAKQFQQELTLEQVIYAEKLYGAGEFQTLAAFKALHDKLVITPGAAVTDLARAVADNPRHFVLVEVNFDLLIEKHLTVPYRVFATEDEFASGAAYVEAFLAGAETEVPILKLHGTISDFESCVIRVDQTGSGLSEAKRTTLEALLSNLPDEHKRLWVYVGASMRDKDLNPFFLGPQFASAVDERWVCPYLVETIQLFAAHRERRWIKDGDRPTLQDRLITETADTFFHRLAEIVTSAGH